MKNLRAKFSGAIRGAVLALAIGAMLFGTGFELGHLPQTVQAQNSALTTQLSNSAYTLTFTATSQTVKQTIGALSTASITVYGTALSTVTWQVLCGDGASPTIHYFGIPYTTGAVTATYNLTTIVAAGTITTTATTTYWVNLSGCSSFEIVTSGTFTATSVSMRVVASPNKGII